MKNLNFILILLIIIQPCFAVDKASSTAEFLLIPPDARAIAMAEAVSSLPDDVFASYWNPAGLSQLQGISLGYSHNFWFLDFNYDYLTFSYQLKNKGTIGGYVNTLWMKNLIEGMDNTGNFTGEFIGASFYAIGISYGMKPLKLIKLKDIKIKTYIGATAKLIIQNLYKYSATTAGIDLGILNKDILIKGINLGIVIRNLGLSSSFKDVSEKLPLKINFGVSYSREVYEKKQNRVTIIPAVEAGISNNYGFTISTGLEAKYKNEKNNVGIVIRTGYLIASDDYLGKGIRAGIGVNLSKIGVDYAFLASNGLNYIHSISIKYSF